MSFNDAAAAERGMLAFQAFTFTILMGAFATDPEHLPGLTAISACSDRNAVVIGCSFVSSYDRIGSEFSLIACAIKCTESFVRVKDEGWKYSLKKLSMSSLAILLMNSTSLHTVKL
jgi:hypothetical protein